jgi:hypothetical protein
MADDFTYHAITLIPNFLVTGILAIIVSGLVIIWSVKFVEKKYGVVILFGLCISQVLVGGAWVIDIALITCILAFGIDRPLTWWRSHLSVPFRNMFIKLFPLAVLSYAIISGAMLVLTVIGVNSQILIDALTPLATLMFIPILLMIFGGISVNIKTEISGL